MRLRTALLSAGLAAPLAAQSLFPDTEYPSPSFLADLVAGDIDGDGDRDVLTCGSPFFSPGALQLWLNDGHAGLTTGAPLTVMSGVSALSIGDVNLDGRADVVLSSPATSSAGPGGLLVQLGDGAGGYFATTSQTLLGEPADHLLGDVDGNGVPDVALLTKGFASVAIVTGKGNGSFSAPVYVTMGSTPLGFALGDLQGDGDPDLVVVNGPPATVTRRLGGAGASFGATASFGTGLAPVAALIANLDGDDAPDVLVANSGNSSLSLLRGDGAGGLVPQQVLPALEDPAGFAAADLDLDGDLDVLVRHLSTPPGLFTPNAVSVMLAEDGQLGPATVCFKAAGCNSFAVADLDGDLLPDVAAQHAGARFTARLGDGLGGFGGVAEFPTGSGPLGAALADLDGNGALDVASCTVGPPSGTRLLGDGYGGFGPAASFPLGTSFAASDIAAADITGDGALDLVLVRTQQDAVSLLPGDGLGGFGAALGAPCGGQPRAVATADLDGDADADVLTCDTGASAVAVLANAGGALQAPVLTQVGTYPTAMAVGHVDAGGSFDVVTANEFADSFTVLRGDGAGGWLPAVTSPGEAGWVRPLALLDLDQDGDDDVVAALGGGAYLSQLKVRLSDGAGGLTLGSQKDVLGSPWEFAAADFDLDGVLDVALATTPEFPDTQVQLFLGDGAGGLGAPQAHFFGLDANSLTAGDVNGDGLSDLVSANGAHASIGVLLNAAGGLSAWTPLGSALAGHFAPQLAGAGTLQPGSPGYVALLDLPPLAPAALFFAPTSAPAAFKGGVLVPVPPAVTTLLLTPPGGALQLAWSSFPALTPGSTFYLQLAVADVGAPAGVALSGAIQAVVP